MGHIEGPNFFKLFQSEQDETGGKRGTPKEEVGLQADIEAESLADLCARMNDPYCSPEEQAELRRQIFERSGRLHNRLNSDEV